jgi:tripartite-type tricarboxylate transporter receptor subunit TctC
VLNTDISRRTLLASLVAGAALPSPARAQGGSSGEPLRMIIPFAAGATIDAVGRMVAQKFQDSTRQTVVVDNRTGAGGILGTAMVARAKADGNTIGLVANNFTTTPAVRHDLTFDALKDFAPIALAGYVPYAMAVPAQSPARTVRDLFETAKAKKEPINYGTLGVGSHGHFIGTQLEKITGAPMMQVPFKGQTEMTLAVMGGYLQMAILNLSIAVKQLQEKRLRILATLTSNRHPLTPDIPTFSETGYGTLVENAWYGFIAPAATPVAPLNALRKEISAAISTPDVRASLIEMGIVPTDMTPAQFGELIRSEIAKYARIAKDANIKAD